MKKIISVIVITTLLNLSLTVKASETEVIVETQINMLKQSGQVNSLSSCLGITEKELIEAYKKTVTTCIPKDGLEGQCMETLAPKFFSVSKDKFMACTRDDDETIEQEKYIDYSQLSEIEIVALE
jgi:hypothetical protein